MTKRIWFIVFLIFGLAAVGCASSGDDVVTPPPIPSEEELIATIADPPLVGQREKFITAIQQYCKYTDECETTHNRLEFFDYGFRSFSTVVHGDTITIGELYIIHLSRDGSCPADQYRIGTSLNVTAQWFEDAEGNVIDILCFEPLANP